MQQLNATVHCQCNGNAMIQFDLLELMMGGEFTPNDLATKFGEQ
jgi:hypothetical protein